MRKNISRLISLILIVAMALLYTGCGQNVGNAVENSDESVGSQSGENSNESAGQNSSESVTGSTAGPNAAEEIELTPEQVLALDPEAKLDEDGNVILTSKRHRRLYELEGKYGDLNELEEYILENFYKEVERAKLRRGAKYAILNAFGQIYSDYMDVDAYYDLVDPFREALGKEEAAEIMNEREGADGKGDGEGYGDGGQGSGEGQGADGSNSDGSGGSQQGKEAGNAPSQKPIEKVADSEFKGGVTVSLDRYLYLAHLEREFVDVEELYAAIVEKCGEELDLEPLILASKRGVFQVLKDPYSEYYSADEFAPLMEMLSGEFIGIGIYFDIDYGTQKIVVNSVIADTPADKAGIEPGDIVMEIDGVEVSARDTETFFDLLDGDVGTLLNLKVYRESTDETIEASLIRMVIEAETVESEMLTDDIGYILLYEFADNSGDELHEHLDALIEQGAKGLILDLRNNPGGSVNTCLQIADLFLSDKLVVTTRGRGPYTNGEEYSSEDFYDIELIVLVNMHSASASELLSGALQDNGRAQLVGTKTFGKGIIQNVIPFGAEEGFKLTISEYYTPAGVCIHGVGITPDFVVAQDRDFILSGARDKDAQLNEAIKIMEEKLGKN